MPFFDLPLADLEQYLPDVAEPPDFDAFWADTLAQARQAGDQPVRVERVDTGLTEVVVDDVTFPGFGGHPVKAWLLRPARVEHGQPLPAVVQYVGYGGGRGLPHERLELAASGVAHLLMDTRGQGGGTGTGGETPDPVGSGPAAPGFLTRGLENPRDHYYRRVFTDAVRAVDAVRGIEGIDRDRVSVLGTSQGGGIAIAVAGLVPDLVVAMPDVPFLCHYRRAVEISGAMPYGELTKYLSVRRDRAEEAFRTLSYLDGVCFARRATAPALFSVALMDTTCPPSTVYAAYNSWGAGAPGGTGVARQMDVYEFNGHEGGQGYRFPAHLRWLRHHLAAG